ncbi:hypothetical protein C8J57DRAFT_1528512 [Mycena rebaudengoi]|nr:hypothetical protein C8J57DRAFT_1528512 [Mycena rebaudengoi]
MITSPVPSLPKRRCANDKPACTRDPDAPERHVTSSWTCQHLPCGILGFNYKSAPFARRGHAQHAHALPRHLHPSRSATSEVLSLSYFFIASLCRPLTCSCLLHALLLPLPPFARSSFSVVLALDRPFSFSTPLRRRPCLTSRAFMPLLPTLQNPNPSSACSSSIATSRLLPSLSPSFHIRAPSTLPTYHLRTIAHLSTPTCPPPLLHASCRRPHPLSFPPPLPIIPHRFFAK